VWGEGGWKLKIENSESGLVGRGGGLEEGVWGGREGVLRTQGKL